MAAIFFNNKQNIMDKYYSVRLVTTSVAEMVIKAKNKRQAVEIANMEHIDWSQKKEEVINQEFDASMLKERPKGEIIMTNTGYIDSDDKVQDLID
jgi:hypothetical protein